MSTGRRAKDSLTEALTLPEAQRVRLVADILRSVKGPPETLDDDAWVAELRERAERVLRGERNGRPWHEVRDALLAGSYRMP